MINGQPYTYYGFVPIAYRGFLNMPSRVGDVIVDWGDYVEPLVHEDDLSWGARDLQIDVLYDNRLTNLTFRQAIEELLSVNRYFDIVNQFGTFTVKLKEARQTNEHYENSIVYRLFFSENEQSFTGSVPSAVGGGGLTIDGYSLFNDFDVLLEKVTLLNDVASLKVSSITTEFPEKPFTDFRTFGTLKIHCHKVRTAGYLTELAYLRALLATPGMRTLVHNNVEYKCFLSEGYVATINKGIVSFVISLNVMDSKIVGSGGDLEDKQYSLGNKRKYLESLFADGLFENTLFQ